MSGPFIVPQSNSQVLLSIAGIYFMGVLLIAGTGILAGLWSSRFHSPRELESAIGAPVLATVPLVVDGNPRKTLAGQYDGGMSLRSNGSDSYQEGEPLESVTGNRGPQVLSPISRYVGGVEKSASNIEELICHSSRGCAKSIRRKTVQAPSSR